MILDVGANADCKPIHLYQFAHMGASTPAGAGDRGPDGSGCSTSARSRPRGARWRRRPISSWISSRDALSFVGNVEGRDIFAGATDVVVCDGFTGNVILKLAGSIAGFGGRVIARESRRNPWLTLGALMMKPALSGLKRRFNYEEYGGALLLGTRGVSIICHGKSSPRAIRNAVRVALRSVRRDLEGEISRSLSARAPQALSVAP